LKKPPDKKVLKKTVGLIQSVGEGIIQLKNSK